MPAPVSHFSQLKRVHFSLFLISPLLQEFFLVCITIISGLILGFALSPQGLLKASKVLQETYGSMHVTFGRPLSVRRLCQNKINRCQYNLMPRLINLKSCLR